MGGLGLGSKLSTLKRVVSKGAATTTAKSPVKAHIGTTADNDLISLGSLVDDFQTFGVEERKQAAILGVTLTLPSVKNPFRLSSVIKKDAPPQTQTQSSQADTQTESDTQKTAQGLEENTATKETTQPIRTQAQKTEDVTDRVEHTATTLEKQLSAVNPTPQKLSSLSWAQFERVRVIGSGSYGCVSLVRHLPTGMPCVIKAVSKAYAFAKKEQQHTLNEKDILSEITITNCPFSAHVFGYFQDDTHLYYVLEYVAGGELFTMMVEYDKFDDSDTRFFVAQLALVLEHMHSLGIVYRDIKPENMLLDELGYIKVCDFGFARFLQRGQHAYTMCGTPEYIAPEILKGKGHGLAADLWSLGIFAYELLCARTPFEGGSSRATHFNILEGGVRFPDYVTPKARDFISGLLSVDETERLGNGHEGFSAIFGHPWMAGLDLNKLLRREIKSPIDVRVTYAFDSRNFDRFAPEEERSSACPPVTPEQNEFFAGFDSVTREIPRGSISVRPTHSVSSGVFA